MRFTTLALAIGWMFGAGAVAYGADAERGKALYDARCDLCHRTSIHVRDARKATSFDNLRGQVARWNAELGGAWSLDEINDVTLYLNSHYYQFPRPDSLCGGGRADAELRRTRVLIRK